MEISKYLSFRSLLVAHFCENNAFYILLSWMPTYFHENFPTARVSHTLSTSVLVGILLWHIVVQISMAICFLSLPDKYFVQA